MYARSTTYQGRPGSIDEGIAYVRDEVMPAAMGTKGCIGLSMICNRTSARCIISSAWATKEALDGTEHMMERLRLIGEESFGAEASVERWEMAVLHRHAASGEGACVRCTWLEMDVARLSYAIETYRMATLPVLEEMDGFCSASLMVNRDTGRAVASATFTSRDAMVSSRPAAEGLRGRDVKEIGATVTDVEEFELALAHLHVPEMARAGQY